MTKIESDPDYISLGHHGNSLARLKERYPDEVPPHIVAKALAMTEHRVRALYAVTIRQIRRLTGMARDE